MRNRCWRALVAVTSAGAALAVFAASSWAAPSITSFAPTQGALGTSVIIGGSGFTGATSVTFGGVAASTFTVNADTNLTATVPTLAKTGTITITAPSGSGTSTASFRVLPGISLSRTVGPPTTALSVSGSGFAANEPVDIYEGATDVIVAATDAGGTFSGVPIAIPSWAPPGALWISAVGRHSLSGAQSAFTVRTDWLSGRGSVQNNGWNPFENVLYSSNVSRLEETWSTTGANFLSNGPPGVIVAAGKLVGAAAIRSTLNALTAATGAGAWSQSLNTSFFSGPAPADGSGTVVAAGTDGKVHAYALSSGAPRWTSAGPSDTGNGSPIVNGGDVLVPGASALTDYNLSTGAVRWSYTGPCTGSLSTPAIEASTVLFTCTNSSGAPVLVSLGSDGTFYHWFSTGAGTTSAPAIHGGNVYALLGGSFVGYSLSAFNPKWSLTPPFSVSTDPAAGDGIVATCGAGGLWVVNAADGTTRFADAGFGCSAPVTIANGVIYEPRNGDIAMFDEWGSRLGRLGTGGNVGPVAVADGAVYAADSIAGFDRWALPPAASTATVRAKAHRRRPNIRRLHPNLALKPYRHQRAHKHAPRRAG
jgi:PQQ-like domain